MVYNGLGESGGDRADKGATMEQSRIKEIYIHELRDMFRLWDMSWNIRRVTDLQGDCLPLLRVKFPKVRTDAARQD